MDTINMLALVIAVGSSAASLILSIRKLRQGSPTEKRLSTNERRLNSLEAWRPEVDAKLDRDNKKIKGFEDTDAKNEEFQRVALRALKGLVDAVTKTGDTDAKNISNEIDEFLIGR